MRRFLALVLIAGLALLPGCRKQPEGALKVIAAQAKVNKMKPTS